jgi:cellulose biosynthesis protein BcsQ
MTLTGNARVVLVANRKGGVGKSSLVAAAANAIASGGRGGGRKVLVIDGDPQGTITKSDLGARDRNDGGESLGMSLLFGRHDLEPLIAVKPNLDVVAGGTRLSKAIAGAAAMDSAELVANFQGALERLCATRGYDFVFIDSAPGEMPLLKTFMSTANYLVIPTMSDGGSLDAVEDVADSFKEARLFCADPNAHVRNADVFDQIEELLGASGVAPFRTLIREAKAAAIDCRNLGVTPAELVEVAKQARKDKFKALDAGEKPDRTMWASNPAKLAADYQALVYEIVSRIAHYESANTDYETNEAARLAAVGR